MRRRTILAGGAGLAALGTAGGTAAALLWSRDDRPDPVIPTAPPGDERLERRASAARGRTVDFYTAVPAGHGDGRGLPVCLVLHGGSKTARDFPALGLGRFLTDAVDRGAAPFVLAGATGDRLSWRPSGGDDPQRMVHEEIPAWCVERGFDTTRVAVWGWSMGGYGALLFASEFPGFVRSVAAFSPAVRPGDDVFTRADRLRGTPIGLWCGRDDDFYDDVRALQRALPIRPAAGGYTDGRHSFGYWSTVIPAAFDFVAASLALPSWRARRPAAGR
jgi:pimeloyl-ACP methyl ester carboxylesterase